MSDKLTEPLRKCSCGITAYTEADLPLFEPGKRNKYGRTNRCKGCATTKVQKYRQENPKTSYLSAKRSKVKCTYGITLEEYYECMRTSEVCEKCGKDYDLEYDHDHITMNFRGVLCGTCNRALGALVGDSLEEAEWVVEYLKRSKEG